MSDFSGWLGVSTLLSSAVKQVLKYTLMSGLVAFSLSPRAIATSQLMAQSIPSNPPGAHSPTPQTQPPFELNDFTFWSDQCLSLGQTQQYSEALSACEKAIALKPKANNLDLWMARSNALFELRQYTNAIASYQHILTLQPQSSFALTQQCAALFRLGQAVEAIDLCENALRINGDWGRTTPLSAWYYRGLALISNHHWQEALESFDRARLINSDDLLTRAERCRALVMLGQENTANDPCNLTDAVVFYERALSINPNDDLPWFHQSIVLMQLKQEERALTSLNRVLQIKPNASLALAYRCTILNHQNQYEQALNACNLALQGDGIWDGETSAIAWSQQSHALIGLGQYANALESAQRATAIRPDYAEAWNNLGVSYWQLNAYPQAIDALKQAIQLNPHYTQAWYNQGRAYSSSNQYLQAIQAYCQALYQANRNPPYCSGERLQRLSMQPIDPLTQSDILANLGAVIWRADSNNRYARDAVDAAVNLNPHSFIGQYNRGLILEESDAIEALKSYQAANCIYPQQPYVLTGIGRVLIRQGKLQEASNIFEIVLTISPQYMPAVSELGQSLDSIRTQASNDDTLHRPSVQDMLACPVPSNKQTE